LKRGIGSRRTTRIGEGFLYGSVGKDPGKGGSVIRICLIIILAFGLAGCSGGKKLEKLLTLKGLANEQDAMGNVVEEQDRKFAMMVEEKKAGTLDQYLSKRKFARIFGDPIFVDTVDQEDKQLDVWMYRYAAKFSGSEKIYLYFGPDGNIVESKYVEGSDGEIR